MSWLEQLYKTYENAQAQADSTLWPMSHFMKNAHIEVVIDANGHYQVGRTRCLSGEEAATLIPASESSAGRSGAKIAPHPLCEELGYCAEDLPKAKAEKFSAYQQQLKVWCASENTHKKANAIFAYISKGTVWHDLSKEVDFPLTFKNKSGQATKVEPEKAFIRWKVEEPGEPCSSTWEDTDLIKCWIKHDAAVNTQQGFCNVLGKQTRIASNHPRFIRHSGDGAKIISSNDSSGYTFRGKFYTSEQACSVSFEVSQKAHNALRWLISRQGYRNDEQVFVSWAVSGEKIPDPMEDTYALLLDSDDEALETSVSSDVGQAFGKRLALRMKGYGSHISDATRIVVMGLESATPGRMAITFYRDLEKSEFLERIEHWHKQFAWHQNFSKEVKFIGAPAPRDIAEAAYGRRIDDKLKKSTVERLLPCIIDQSPFPQDLMLSTVRRVCNRVGMESWEWEKTLGIACSLFRGIHQQENYQMSLEEDRTSRDYLYGRLLAIADNVEFHALRQSQEERDTSAGKLMQRFSTNPYETWKVIELALNPYRSRLRANAPALLSAREKLLDEIMNKFAHDEFTRLKSPLSGEFLLAFHCQRQAFRKKADTGNITDTSTPSDN